MKFDQSILALLVASACSGQFWAAASGSGGSAGAYGRYQSYGVQQQHHEQQQPWQSSDQEPYAPQEAQSEDTLPPLPDGWSEHIDPSSGQPYYFNAADGTTTWERPIPEPTPEKPSEEVSKNEDQSQTEQPVGGSSQDTGSTPSEDVMETKGEEPALEEQLESVTPSKVQGEPAFEEKVDESPPADQDIVTDYRRSEEAIQNEEKWRSAQGWDMAEDALASSAENPPSAWGVSREQQANEDRAPVGWGMKESPSQGAPEAVATPPPQSVPQHPQLQRDPSQFQQPQQQRDPSEFQQPPQQRDPSQFQQPQQQRDPSQFQQPQQQQDPSQFQQPQQQQDPSQFREPNPQAMGGQYPRRPEQHTEQQYPRQQSPDTRQVPAHMQGRSQPPSRLGQPSQQTMQGDVAAANRRPMQDPTSQPPKENEDEAKEPEIRSPWEQGPPQGQSRPDHPRGNAPPPQQQRSQQSPQQPRQDPSNTPQGRHEAPGHRTFQAGRPSPADRSEQAPGRQGPAHQRPPPHHGVRRPSQGVQRPGPGQPPSHSRPQGPPGQGPPRQYSQGQPRPHSQNPYAPHGQHPGQYGHYGQYGTQQQQGGYSQQQQTGPGHNQMVTQEEAPKDAVREALGSAWQGLLGFGNRTKEAVGSARNSVVETARGATQSLTETSSSLLTQAKDRLGSVFEGDEEGTDSYSLTGRYGAPPAPGSGTPQSPQQQGNPYQRQQPGYPYQQQQQKPAAQAYPPHGQYPPGYGPPRPRSDDVYPPQGSQGQAPGQRPMQSQWSSGPPGYPQQQGHDPNPQGPYGRQAGPPGGRPGSFQQQGQQQQGPPQRQPPSGAQRPQNERPSSPTDPWQHPGLGPDGY